MITDQVFCWDSFLGTMQLKFLSTIWKKTQRFAEDSVIKGEVSNKKKKSLTLFDKMEI